MSKLTGWQPISTAPKNKPILLLTKFGMVYVGQEREGNYSEPQQHVLSWRSDCCGRFSNPIMWHQIPEL